MIETPTQFYLLTDPMDIKRAVKVDDVLGVLWDYDQELRSMYKYHGREEANEFRELLHEFMSNANVSLDELYS